MTFVAVILILVVAGGATVALWLRRSVHRSEEAFAERVRRYGLGPFEQLDGAAPGAGQAAVVTPPDEAYGLACEELVALQRLVRTPSGDYVRLVRPSR